MFINGQELNQLQRLQREMDYVFGGVVPNLLASRGNRNAVWGSHFPAVNVWENEESYAVEAEIPGLTMADLDLTVLGNELTIRGARKSAESGEKKYHRRERGTGEFARVVHLPTDVKAEAVDAQLKNGVLTVMLPKAEAAKPKKINVSAV